MGEQIKMKLIYLMIIIIGTIIATMSIFISIQLQSEKTTEQNATELKIILRIDDIGDNNESKIILDELIKRNMTAVLGVIPAMCKLIL